MVDRSVSAETPKKLFHPIPKSSIPQLSVLSSTSSGAEPGDLP